MSNVIVLEANECDELLTTAVTKQFPAILTYMSKNKWHVSKIVITSYDGRTLHIESTHAINRRQPINIKVGQPVGLSFKYAYGKFVFDTTVQSLEPSQKPGNGGAIALNRPRQIEVIKRRSYYRVFVPKSLSVKVALWHRISKTANPEIPHKYFEGILTDISAGGAMIAIPHTNTTQEGVPAKPDFHKGQFIGLRFTPLPYEKPIIFNAQIRNILPTADNTALCLGLQMVGLEASSEGQHTLTRIAEIVETYHQMNEDEKACPVVESPANQQPAQQ
jgi:hypothetical protein